MERKKTRLMKNYIRISPGGRRIDRQWHEARGRLIQIVSR